MAMTVTSVLFLGLVALVTSMSFVVDFGEQQTPVVLGFLSSMLWAAMGLSSFSVHSEAWTGTEPMYPLAYAGFGLAAITALFALYRLARLIGAETGATDPTGM